ncbi:MAG TPA: GNAT family N-acetyltransferase [Anaerolineaceae bacterium]|nr:GNAT family N-acetyltransferase [Anaerolineaceae bacterium]HPN53279.1 GNAT family N-acetyltransferase [Anaerolineaceae bacterium]
MPEIEIRPMIESDMPILMGLEHNYRSHYVWQMDLAVDAGQTTIVFREVRLPRPVDVDYPRQPMAVLQEWKDAAVVLVAEHEGVPAAYIVIQEDMAPSTAWITDLVVAPSLRRQGIGSTLMLAAQSWAVQRGSRRMVLETQSKNHAGISMALKLGFEFSGYHDRYFLNQDIALFFARFLR